MKKSDAKKISGRARTRFVRVRNFLTATRENAASKVRPAFPVLYALLLETTELGLFAFVGLLTIEAVLPGIISMRLNMSLPFAGILIIFAAAAALGRRLGISFPFAPDKKSPLTWIGISWLAFLLTLSTIRFPYWSIPIIVGGMFAAAHLFWKLLFRSEKI
ncbi:MAG: hypothetical protein HGB37_03990 [Candidatus Moranbacteria bacterium]|nr:hypothetical protein [Candidatus Moranbacteria bacterium]